MFFGPFVFIRHLLFFGLGIYFYEYTKIHFSWLMYIVAGFSLIYLILVIFLKKRLAYKYNFLFGFLAFLILFLIGWQRAYIQQSIHDPNHLIHIKRDFQYYKAVVVDQALERPKSYKVTLQLNQIYTDSIWVQCEAKILLYIRKDSLQKTPLHYGDVILVQGQPQNVEKNKNPFAFDYAQYLFYQNIFHQHFIQPDQYNILYSKPPSLWVSASIRFREQSDVILKKYIQSVEEYGIASALLLGIKEGLNDDILTAYSNTGIVHVLAVSGMHITLIFYLLLILTKPIQNMKGGYLLVFCGILIVIWFYAFITGLSASVLRAAVMFTFILIGKLINRRANMYNILAVSAFFLLFYDPYLMFSAGFLLSYMAVLSIVYFYPKVYQLFEFNNYYKDLLWQLLAISIAAQILTTPISIYYFHQFPNYFLVSNLLIVPISTVAMYVGITLLALQFIPFVNTILGFVLQLTIWIMNQVTFRIEKLPYALTEQLDITLVETYLIYLFILFMALLFERRKYFYLPLGFVVFGMLIFSISFRAYQNDFQKKMTIYDLKRLNNLQFTSGSEYQFFADSLLYSGDKSVEYALKNNFLRRGLNYSKSFHSNKLTASLQKDNFNIIVFYKKKILLVENDLNNQDLHSLKGEYLDYVLIRNNSLKDLELLTTVIKCKIFIFESTNALSTIDKVIESNVSKVKIWSVSKDGAFQVHF